jgi:GT2 family glycosyltransferase/glycosyltransferase involved in cell wall biosynthesis
MREKTNSQGYWDERFRGHWREAGGPEQTAAFYKAALELFPSWFRDALRAEKFSICDWGCATGEGTVLLQEALELPVVGIDFSEVAIAEARVKHPDVKFLQEDWFENAMADTCYDVVFSSNTLEHFHDPWTAASRLVRRANAALVFLLPYREEKLYHEHCARFEETSIPVFMGDNFRLTVALVVDLSSIAAAQWAGKQILLVYCAEEFARRHQKVLADAPRQDDNYSFQLEIARAEKGQLAECLNQTKAELEQSTAEAGRLIELLARTNADLETAKRKLARLRHRLVQNGAELQKANSAITDLKLRLLFWEDRARALESSTSWRLTHPLRMGVLMARQIAKAIWQHLSHIASAPIKFIHPERIYIFASVPFDDVGGGQRGAQLARVLATSGFQVTYVYAYRRYDFELQREVESAITFPRIRHSLMKNVSVETVFEGATPGSVAIFELPHREYLPFLHKAKNEGVSTLFELMDAWDTSLGGDWFSDEVYEEFVKVADRVVGTARLLVDNLVARGRPDAEYLPNAVNDLIFDHYCKHRRPSEYNPGKRAILYYGSLYGEWFGWDYVKAAATLNSDAIIYLIGDAPLDLRLPANVRLLGSRRIEELPAYLQNCDLAILPFVPGKISDAVSPIKVFEYLAMGKPVVATALPEIKDYPNVFSGRSAAEFAELCSRRDIGVLNTESFIMQNTWQGRVVNLLRPKIDQRVSVIVLMHNNRNIIGRCIESILLHGTHHVKELIIVDNSSTDDGGDYVRSKYPNVKLLSNPNNGCSSGRNIGLREAAGDVICFFDSDQWLTSSLCFKEAMGILFQNRYIGAISWSAGWLNFTSDHLGGPICDYLPGRGTRSERYISEGYRTDVHYLGTGGFFARREVLEETHLFDERFDPTCFEDADLSMQILSEGYTLAYRNLTGIRHEPHQTTGAGIQADAYKQLFKRNSRYFHSKWSTTLARLVPSSPSI